MRNIYLSVVIPAYNEQVNFAKNALGKVRDYLQQVDYSHEVIIVDDGSNDGSVAKIKKFCEQNKRFKLLSRPHLGKAATIYAGLKQAQGELVLFTDFDQATPMGEVEKLIPFIKKGYDLVIGSREVEGAKREQEPFYRHLMGRVFNLVVKIIAFGGIADTQCGFKLFKTRVALDLFRKIRVYHFESNQELKHAFTGAIDVELLYLARKGGYKIAEVPVYWQHYQTSRVNPLRDSTKMFLDVIRIKINGILGRYE